jgi:pseudouridine synthase
LERLQKFLAHAGIGSRRSCEELILQGKVKINGKVVTKLGTKVDPDVDRIEVNNKPIEKEEQNIYILLNKPDGYVTTVKDPQGRPTVIDLLKDINQRVYPVGRLDYETEGLLILTNDGQLAFRLTHPKYKINKVYEVLVKGHPDNKALEQLRNGIELGDGLTEPARVKILKLMKNSTLLEVTIYEGRNRQVRRMCKAVNHPVLNLKRVQVGPIKLGKLPKGSYRLLTSEEVKQLRKSIGLR